jgi:2-aminoadipate transaminase
MNGVSRERASGADLLAQEASARAQPSDTDLQYGHTAGVIDLTWGHPDPSALATDAVADATQSVLAERGWQALSYGAPAGAASLRAELAEHLSRTDAPTRSEQIVVVAGSSGGLDLILGLLSEPGDVVFVEQPTYFLALRMFADHGLRVVGLQSDVDGPDPQQLAVLASDVAMTGASAFLYIVPTFANPTGRCMPVARADQLLTAAAAHGVTVIEDDVYRDTTVHAPPSMWSRDPSVLRLGSFSKSLAPGLRVGHLTTTAEMADRFAGCGLFDSGGGANHFAAMVVGEVMRSGRFTDVVRSGQQRYAERRAALANALDPSLFQFEVPQGGFFLWLGLPEGLSSNEVVAAARAGGVLVSNGSLFYTPAGDERRGTADASHVRLSFSMLHTDLLTEGAARLNQVVSSMLR